MRKFFAFVLTMALVFTAFSSTTTFAAEVEAKENLIVITDSASNIGVTSTKGLRSYAGTMVGGSSYSFYLNNVGPNPTFVFYITGSPNTKVSVEMYPTLGTSFTAFNKVACDGTSHTTSHSNIFTTDYLVTIWVSGGTTSGESKPFAIAASW